ncbi:MAG: hypothetical protein AAFY39_01675 [Pseudomonadota bacterium]
MDEYPAALTCLLGFAGRAPIYNGDAGIECFAFPAFLPKKFTHVWWKALFVQRFHSVSNRFDSAYLIVSMTRARLFE